VRIAIVAPPWVPVPPPAYGGTETVLDTLARGLSAAGHEVVLWTTGDSTCLVPRRHVLERALGTASGAMASELRHVVGAYAEMSGVDVVHDHTLVGPVYADRLPWLPVVTTNHGPFQSDLSALYRATSDRVPVIAISHHQAAGAEGVRLAGVIHHGVDPGAFPVGDGSGGYAVFLGRMSPDKGVDTAVRVARRAGVPLLIAAKMAEANEKAYFDQKVKPILGDGVEYIGELGSAAKLELLGRAICLINPIAWPEPFGMVMIEAMATGTPVVATPCGAVPEIVVDGLTGFIRSGEESLADAVARIGEIDRRDCRARVEGSFSAEQMVDAHLEVYRTVIEERRPPALALVRRAEDAEAV